MAHRITRQRAHPLSKLPTPWSLESVQIAVPAYTRMHPLGFLTEHHITTVSPAGQIQRWPRSGCTQFRIVQRGADRPESLDHYDLAMLQPGSLIRDVHTLTGAHLDTAMVLEDAALAGLDDIGRVQVLQARDLDHFHLPGPVLNLQQFYRQDGRWMLSDTLGRRKLVLPRKTAG